MKKSIFLLAVTFFLALCCNAQENVTVKLKDGTALFGYIVKRMPNAIVFKSEYGVRIKPKASVTINEPEDELRKSKVLGPQFSEWAKKNSVFKNNATAQLKTLVDKKSDKPQSLFVAEQGANILYFDFTDKEETINWSNIDVIKADRRNPLELSGINTKYVLKNGKSIEGQFAEETNTTLGLYTNPNKDDIARVKIEDITKYIYTGVDAERPIFEQSPYIDVIETTMGPKFEGVITEKNYSEGKFVYQPKEGEKQTVKIEAIASTSRKTNNNYQIVMDNRLDANMYQINRQNVSTFTLATGDKGIIVNGNPHEISRDNYANLTLEYAEKTVAGNFRLFKVTNAAMPAPDPKAKKSKKNVEEVQEAPVKIISLDEYVNYGEDAVESSTSHNGIVKVEFKYPAPGEYVLYDQYYHKGFYIIVK